MNRPADPYAPWDAVIKHYISWNGVWEALMNYLDPKFYKYIASKVDNYYKHPERYASLSESILFLVDILSKGAKLPEELKQLVKISSNAITLIIKFSPQGQVATHTLKFLAHVGLNDLKAAVIDFQKAILAAKGLPTSSPTDMIRDGIKTINQLFGVNAQYRQYPNGSGEFLFDMRPPSRNLITDEFDKLFASGELDPEQQARVDAFYEREKKGHYELIPARVIGRNFDGSPIMTQDRYTFVPDEPTAPAKNEVPINTEDHNKTMPYAYVGPVKTGAPYAKWVAGLEQAKKKATTFAEAEARTGLSAQGLVNEATKAVRPVSQLIANDAANGNISPEGLIYIYETLTPGSTSAPPHAPKAPEAPTKPILPPSPYDGHNGIADAMIHVNPLDEEYNKFSRSDKIFENPTSAQLNGGGNVAPPNAQKDLANLIQTTERELLFEELYHKPFDYGPVPFYAEREPATIKTRVVTLPFKAPRRLH